MKLKTLRKKNPPEGCKWEADSVNGEYIIIRYKNNWLDVRVSKSYDDFLLGSWRSIYRNNLDNHDENSITFEEVVTILDIDISEIDYY